MTLSTKPFLIAAVVFGMLSSCQKELSFENTTTPAPEAIDSSGGSSTGTAVFRMEGAPYACDSYVVGGTYYPGRMLNATNAVEINVLVSDTGTFNIATAEINGMRFAASGTFRETGSQPVLLQGTGKALSYGTFNYKPGSTWCSFPITTLPQPIGPVATGIPDCTLAWSQGSFPPGIDMTDATKIFVPVNVTVAGFYNINTAPINGLTYSATGILQAGPQIITLTSRGRPVKFGHYPLTLCFGESRECSFEIFFQ